MLLSLPTLNPSPRSHMSFKRYLRTRISKWQYRSNLKSYVLTRLYQHQTDTKRLKWTND